MSWIGIKRMVNFICLKWGTKYDAEYVNRLYAMLKRNCREQFTLHCCTEDSSEINSEIEIIKLPIDKYDLESWWWKMWILSKEFPVKGGCIFFDLDIVIQNDIQEIIDFDCSDHLYALPAQWRMRRRLIWKNYYTSINSSVMIWDSRKIPDIFSDYIQNNDYYEMRHPGNDEYLEREYKGVKMLPAHWAYSRLAGFDDTDEEHMWDYVTEEFLRHEFEILYKMWNMPDRMICLFNGIRPEDHLDNSVYDGYEHYWSDSIS
jgi:hypothetical protein